jgi:hypothetical protein
MGDCSNVSADKYLNENGKRYRDIDSKKLTEDFRGNNLALTCPHCGKVFIVSGLLDHDGKKCPNPACGKSKGFVVGSVKTGGFGFVEW